MFVTNTDRVRAEIESRIVTGLLEPGVTLDESELSKQFSVSRTPVREALLQLSAEGYIKIVPRSGIYVVRLTTAELADMFETLAHAEGLCAKLVIQRINATQLKALTQLHQDGKKAVVAKDLVAYSEYNQAFHEFLYRCCGNSYLMRQIVQMRRRINPYRERALEYTDRVARSWQEHDRLLAAIVAGDEHAAMHEAAHHILSGEQVRCELAPAMSNRADRLRAKADESWGRGAEDSPYVLEPLTQLH